jgi:hypothetical protein
VPIATDSRIVRLEGRVDEIAQRLTSLENGMNARFNAVEARLNTITLIVFGNVATTIVTAVGIIAELLITR